MKKVIIFSMCILNIFAGYSQIWVASNYVGWYGKTIGYSIFTKDSTEVRAVLERNSKNIYTPPITWLKNLPGYELRFSVFDYYNCYLKIDSIVFNIYSIATSNSILRSTLAEDNQFTSLNPLSREDYGHYFAILNKVYILDDLKRHKKDLLIDFTLYLQTKNNEQRKVTYSRYELKYEKSSGVAFWRY